MIKGRPPLSLQLERVDVMTRQRALLFFFFFLLLRSRPVERHKVIDLSKTCTCKIGTKLHSTCIFSRKKNCPQLFLLFFFFFLFCSGDGVCACVVCLLFSLLGLGFFLLLLIDPFTHIPVLRLCPFQNTRSPPHHPIVRLILALPLSLPPYYNDDKN